MAVKEGFEGRQSGLPRRATVGVEGDMGTVGVVEVTEPVECLTPMAWSSDTSAMAL